VQLESQTLIIILLNDKGSELERLIYTCYGYPGNCNNFQVTADSFSPVCLGYQSGKNKNTVTRHQPGTQ